MKYIFSLLAICFCLALSVDVGAAPQHCATEFVRQEAQPIFCEALVLDFAIVPSFAEPLPSTSNQPGGSHGNLERLCGICDGLNYNYPSPRFEAPGTAFFPEKWESAFEPDENSNGDWKVGWQA